MRNEDPWTSFDSVYCLTLEGDLDRQRHASEELCKAGLGGFVFVEGVKADSQEVRDAYATGLVQSFPPCFRCGQATCGRDDCNNVLIEPQVGCYLSFIKIFRRAVASGHTSFLLAEDDIKFHDYATDLAKAAFRREVLADLGLYSDEPCLIGLGRGAHETERPSFDGQFEFIAKRTMPQNPCFAFNRSFAELALARFHKISHTSDVYIHFELSEHVRHYSLEPPLSYELSTSTGTLESKIHPKLVRVTSEANAPEVRAAAKLAFDRHLKHVRVVPLVILGSPRGGTGYMARAMAEFGLDVGHEEIGKDGISSWMFAVSDVDLPFGAPGHARNSRFVFAEKTIAVIRTSPQAILSLQMENGKNIQSYAFRRRWIKKLFDVDLDAFKTDFDRALAAYVFWYKAVALKKPSAWVRLEHASSDLQRLFDSGFLAQRATPEIAALDKVVNHARPHFGQVYSSYGDAEASLSHADDFLRREYSRLKSEMFAMFYKHL